MDESTFPDHSDRPPPTNFDFNYKPSNRWVQGFMGRHKISVQRKTNTKAHSIYEKIHLIKNYHYFCIYMQATKDGMPRLDDNGEYYCGQDIVLEEPQQLLDYSDEDTE